MDIEGEFRGVRAALPLRPAHEDGGLNRQEFADGDAAAGLLRILVVFRVVVGVDGLFERGERILVAKPAGHRVVNARGEGIDRNLHGAADGLLAKSLGRRVNGDEAAGVQQLGFERLELRVVHLDTATVHAYLSGDDDRVAHGERPRDVGHVEPGHLEQPCAVVDERFTALCARTEARLRDIDDFSSDRLRRRCRSEVANLAHVAEVVEAPGEEHDGIAHGLDADLRELLRGGLTDAWQAGDGVFEGERFAGPVVIRRPTGANRRCVLLVPSARRGWSCCWTNSRWRSRFGARASCGRERGLEGGNSVF